MKRWLRFSQLAQKNRAQRWGAGYTLTEVIVVLAVSTMMFSAIALSFAGRSARVQFTQSVRDYEARLQTLISEVESGQYESTSECSVPSNGPPVLGGPSGTSGTNRDCIFIGKMMMSKETDTDIVSLVGRRLTSGANPENVDNIYEARPIADDSRVVSYNHPFDLEILRVVRLSDNITGVAAFGFMNQLAGSNASGNSNLVQLYGMLNTTIPTSTNAEMNKIRNPVTLNDLVPLPDGLALCLLGGNGQEAIIRIGENGGNTTIKSELDTQNIVGGPC